MFRSKYGLSPAAIGGKKISYICAARQIPCRQAQEKQHLVFRAMPRSDTCDSMFLYYFCSITKLQTRYERDRTP